MGRGLWLQFVAYLLSWSNSGMSFVNVETVMRVTVRAVALSISSRYTAFWCLAIGCVALWSHQDLPCPKDPQVRLKRLESLKQHNNKFTFNFWPHLWRFLVVWKRNALAPPFLKTAENSFFKCFREKTTSLTLPPVRGALRKLTLKRKLGSTSPPCSSPQMSLFQCSCSVPILCGSSLHQVNWDDCSLGGFILP